MERQKQNIVFNYHQEKEIKEISEILRRSHPALVTTLLIGLRGDEGSHGKH